MGLFDYYRQFEGLSEDEVNRGLRTGAEARRSRALARIEPIDCRRTTWHELPAAEIVAAITLNARRGMHRYAEGRDLELRELLGARHDVAAGRIVIGEGASGILQRATHELLSEGDEMVIPWPCYPLYPLLARDARATPVPVPGLDPERLLAAVTPRTRLLVLGSPNDPTGELLPAAVLEELLVRLPEHVTVILDEALREFVTAEPVDATIRLTDRFPRLLIVRSFSKAWGLAGLRCGYAVGSDHARELLQLLAPRLGAADLSLTGAITALRTTTATIDRRGRDNAQHRTALAAALRSLGLMVTPSQSCALWVRAPDGDGLRLGSQLEHGGILVQSGEALGDPSHVRITVRDTATTDQIARVLRSTPDR